MLCCLAADTFLEKSALTLKPIPTGTSWSGLIESLPLLLMAWLEGKPKVNERRVSSLIPISHDMGRLGLSFASSPMLCSVQQR